MNLNHHFETLFKLFSPSVGVSARLLEETTVFQVFFDDDVGYGIEHKLDVLCVCGAGHVGVDFFDVSAHVQVQELEFDVVTSILVSVRTLMNEITFSFSLVNIP